MSDTITIILAAPFVVIFLALFAAWWHGRAIEGSATQYDEAEPKTLTSRELNTLRREAGRK